MADPYRIDPATLAAACARARQLSADGSVPEAIALLAAATEAAGEDLGLHHGAVLAAAAALAGLHRDGDDPAAARRVLELHLAEAGRIRGEDDPELLVMAADLGTVAAELGNRHEARRQFARVARLGGPVLGEAHPAVLAARAYLGEAPAATPPPSPTSTAPSPNVAADTAPPPPSAPPSRPPGSIRSAPSPVPVGPVPRPPPARPVAPLDDSPVPPASGAAPAPADVAPLAGSPAAPPLTDGPPPWTGGPAPLPTGPPAAAPTGSRGRAGWVVAAVAIVLALCAAGIATVALLRAGAPPREREPADAVRLTGEPPADVTVAREPGAVVVRWRDPSRGRATFVVTGGQAGAELRLLAQLPAGAPTRYTAAGFHPGLDYCFQVSAVYSTTEFGVASPVCTGRE